MYIHYWTRITKHSCFRVQSQHTHTHTQALLFMVTAHCPLHCVCENTYRHTHKSCTLTQIQQLACAHTHSYLVTHLTHSPSRTPSPNGSLHHASRIRLNKPAESKRPQNLLPLPATHDFTRQMLTPSTLYAPDVDCFEVVFCVAHLRQCVCMHGPEVGACVCVWRLVGVSACLQHVSSVRCLCMRGPFTCALETSVRTSLHAAWE
jgi:hypothetical protein